MKSLTDETAGFEALATLYRRERDEANAALAAAGVHTNKLLGQRNALVTALEETAALAFELMQRAERIDEKLIAANGNTRDCELGEITRLRGQLSKNRATLQSVKE